MKTAILCIHNDAMCSLDKQHDINFIVPYHSTVVISIDHDILVHKIHTMFGIN